MSRYTKCSLNRIPFSLQPRHIHSQNNDSIPITIRPISQYYVPLYACIWCGCKRNGIPFSAHFMYLNTVLRWPEVSYYIAETCSHIVNWKLCCFMINVVFVGGIIYHSIWYITTGWLLSDSPESLLCATSAVGLSEKVDARLQEHNTSHAGREQPYIQDKTKIALLTHACMGLCPSSPISYSNPSGHGDLRHPTYPAERTSVLGFGLD